MSLALATYVQQIATPLRAGMRRLDELLRPLLKSCISLGFIVLLLLGLALAVLSLPLTLAMNNPGFYEELIEVQNVERVRGYRQGHHCLVDWRETFTPLGTVNGVPYMRYASRHHTIAECPTGTMLVMTDEYIARALVVAMAREAEGQAKATLSRRSTHGQ